jgi:hypothetical protein
MLVSIRTGFNGPSDHQAQAIREWLKRSIRRMMIEIGFFLMPCAAYAQGLPECDSLIARSLTSREAVGVALNETSNEQVVAWPLVGLRFLLRHPVCQGSKERERYWISTTARVNIQLLIRSGGDPLRAPSVEPRSSWYDRPTHGDLIELSIRDSARGIVIEEILGGHGGHFIEVRRRWPCNDTLSIEMRVRTPSGDRNRRDGIQLVNRVQMARNSLCILNPIIDR